MTRSRTRVYLSWLVLAVAAALLWASAAQSQQRKPSRAKSQPKRAVVSATPSEPRPTSPDDLQAVVLECVEPEVEDTLPKTPRRAAKVSVVPRRSSGAASATRLKTRGDTSQVSFQSSGAASQLSPDPGTSCRSRANYEFYQNGLVLPNMPAVNFPDQPCQDRSRCQPTTEAWMRAHYYTWLARQVVHAVADQSSQHTRAWMWTRPGVDKNGFAASEKTSPEYWFGPYSDKRLAAVKDGIDKLWAIFTSNKTGGIAIHLECPNSTESSNVCYTKKPAAHHMVKGHIDFCPAFYTYKDAPRSYWDQARLVAHELLHHLWVDWGDVWVAVQDRHYHGHGPACVASPDSTPQYGEDKIRHLATYRNASNGDCGHLARNVRNNDTFAYFIMSIGQRVYNGSLKSWPAPAPPTPQPPQCVGAENCLCQDEETWPANDYFAPDGDYRADQWCDDNDGEMTCVATKYGATVKGTCKKCDVTRGPGCECDNARPCDIGSCYGDDTFNGGVGHCFKDPPPAWACLADCRRLFNDEAAWCYAGYPSGQAHCMDNLCTEPEAYNCHLAGKVCRYGECVVECGGHADCKEKGYPDYFVCNQSRCEADL